MKRPTMLYKALLAQASSDLGVSTERDFVNIRSRFEHEGLSFLTITLPRLSDALEEGLESGRLTVPAGFRRAGSLPALLQGFFRRVFDKSGVLLSEACAESILWIRQLARFYKKPKLACSPRRETKAIARFKKVEEDLYHATQSISRKDEVLDGIATILWSRVFRTFDRDRIVCGHGPGVTADRLSANNRRRIRNWYTRAENSFPSADHANHNWLSFAAQESCREGTGLKQIRLRDELGVRVVFVPKTLTTPRVIAIEPHSMQFMQQGLSRWMVSVLERHWLTAGSVNFTDQSINQKHAHSASISRDLATVDLSDASDRVHLHLVQRIFRRSSILEPLEDARSLHADLPDGSNLVLKKYASMGSALCFPVEACVFYTLILSALHIATGTRPSYSSIHEMKKLVYVYGDDLIFPVEHVDSVCDYLESYGLRVNRSKSFSASAFRESCGSDYYNGQAVKPVYARMDMPEDRRDWTPNHVMSWVSTANQLYLRGWWIAAQEVRDQVDSVLRRSVPISRDVSHGIAYLSCFRDTKMVWNKDLQGWKQKRLVYTPVKTKDNIDGTDEFACYNRAFERFGNLWYQSNWEHDFLDILRQGTDCLRFDDDDESSSSSGQCRPGYNTRREFPRVRYTYPERPRGNPFGSPSDCERLERRLAGKADAITSVDFQNSTKRGAFQPKSRWITLVT